MEHGRRGSQCDNSDDGQYITESIFFATHEELVVIMVIVFFYICLIRFLHIQLQRNIVII